ncbi:MAG: sugar phosphate isomerase [Leeuwenhoekiella sp.]|uniref:sugar phosphate isomerase/epimerase family protein n=1 Tax=unclassified Leeuwenhoekiella TaxID=2615029 RepID=UPI000C418CC8|nr:MULTISPECIES: sugar phosphate isomerase/epimerase [unclassified Leeuwenhoekiella]MAS21248.1 sugar phosphate isomerase [Leeuwenhoekiella sp.]MAW93888.1 sugar phosphate isomerase [Leeuwenhoekiella sp.]MBA81698.1 sugar phosphate isomerase [Leeuwenhoekiella sp.]|tara:strand:- start:15365 stop:16300 length:936 start_codon:yes stop_codon:yes gene_type:complete
MNNPINLNARQFMLTLILTALFLVSCGEKKKDHQTDEAVAADTLKTTNTQFGGLALYTVRDAMGENSKETLKTVAEDGYLNIEAAGYNEGTFYGMSPADFASYLKEVNLKPVSTHQGSVTLDNADQMIADVKAANFTYFVVPVPPMGMFTFDTETQTMGMSGTVEELTSILNTLGEKCEAAGLQLLYHNHDFEYKPNADGIIPIEYMLENTDPKFVNFQMDLFWVTKAGADPVAYFEKYPGRFKLWHVKDMDAEGRFAPVGEGNIDFARILAEKEESGMQYYFVEQDMTFNHTPLEAIKISHKALEEIGFN